MFRRPKQFKLFRTTIALMVMAVSIVGIFAVRAPERLLRNGSPSDLMRQKVEAGEMQESSQGSENGGPGGESAAMLRAMTEFQEARTAPSGIVNPGAYSAAFSQLKGLSMVGGAWSSVTAVKYDADDPDYRDYYSNSSGGAGLVTGRMTGMAADGAGNVYAAGAMGGVWRSTTGGGNWTPIADLLPSLSSGDLELGPDGALWYATGEANTGGTSYVGSGIYRLTNPKSGSFTPETRVGGTELESTTINSLRFTKTRVYAATLRGVWYRELNRPQTEPWTLAYAPNPGYLPADLQTYTKTQTGFGSITTAGNTNAAYKNIVNDIAIDPKNENHIIAAIGWRSGDTYNGFYESNNNGVTWSKVNPQGGIDATDIGYVNFAFSKNGDKLYAINQSPKLLNKFTGVVNSYLDGIYVSNNGNPAGPWTKIAESTKLANSGSALKQAVGGKGYGPGIQSWYNQFIIVDPNDANHVYAGLEEVYETKDGGATWTTVGPYWNFYFSCWNQNILYPPNGPSGANGCPATTHSDQHSIAIGTVNGKQYVFVGNDGGVYRRPLNGSINANGNATDWESLNDGTIDALQYYAVGVGKLAAEDAGRPDIGGTAGSDILVSGGLQDNGGSLVRAGASKMVSNFGGDGGDVLVDPNDGCNIVQEYVVLAMRVTQTCANPGKDRPNAFLDLSQSTTYNIAPPDFNARFIAPFVANATDINEWMAGGNSLWIQNKGFAIRHGSEWKQAYMLPSANQTYTALAMRGSTAVGGWCGPCNNAGFKRGITLGTKGADGAWKFDAVSTAGLPLRFVGGVAIGPDGSVYASINGFSRRFTEGEGAGIGHVFKWNGTSWDDISANFPDVPANSIQALNDGSLVVGTDLAVLYRAPGATEWKRLGTGLPLTVALDVELGPDGQVYAATHGRGIWRVALPGTAAVPTKK